MKNYVLTSGSLTDSGNLTGYSTIGVRVHVYQRQLEALGIKDQNDLKFPMFCVAEEKEFTRPVLDAQGKETGETETFERLTALSLFKTKADLINAISTERLLDSEIDATVEKERKALGLSDLVAKDAASITV